MKAYLINDWIRAAAKSWLEAGLVTDVVSTDRTIIVTTYDGTRISIHTMELISGEAA